MAHNVLMERDIFIDKCINRAGLCATDVDGGCVVVEGRTSATEKELYELGQYKTGGKKIAIAFNPSVNLVKLGDSFILGDLADDRLYTNYAGKVVDYFFPKTEVEFGIHMAGIDGATEPTIGTFLNPKADSHLLEIGTEQDTVPTFEVVDIISQSYPTGNFGTEAEKVFVLKTRFNG